MELISVRVEESLYEEFEEFKEIGEFDNESEAARVAIRTGIRPLTRSEERDLIES